MRVTELEPTGLKLIESPVFEDNRGSFYESYHEEKFLQAGIAARFVQDNQSRSVANVVRGLHAQLARPQGKLVRVLLGEIFDVAVDIRPESPTFGQSAAVTLSAAEPQQLWIPPGFVHGFCVLSDTAQVYYKCTELYDAADEIGVRWNDPELGIEWPVKTPLVSAKDAELPTLAELELRLRSETTPD